MPKQTFFNLPEQKREAIEQAALDEFAAYGFDASNMNRIVEKGKFAKGSFYQYFEDKKDLYLHMIDTLFKKKMLSIEPLRNNCIGYSFSQNLERLLDLGVAFSESEPKLQKLDEDFANKQQVFVNEFLEKYKPEATDIYAMLLSHAAENGELRKGANIQAASFFISSLINQTTIMIMREENGKEHRNVIIKELLLFIERAVLK